MTGIEKKSCEKIYRFVVCEKFSDRLICVDVEKFVLSINLKLFHVGHRNETLLKIFF